MSRMVRNLVHRACYASDEFYTRDSKHHKKGDLRKEGNGDLAAILAIFDRVEGKPSQTVTGPNDGPIKVELRTSEDVRIFLLERGIDAEAMGSRSR